MTGSNFTNWQSTTMKPARNQRGAVLIVSLIILLVLTVVVLSANRGVVMQERMTSAIRQSNLVFQVAESGLIHAEQEIDALADLSGFTNFSATGANGYYLEGNGPPNYLDKDALWNVDGKTLSAANIEDGYTAKYFIESLGEVEVEGQNLDLTLNNNYSQTPVNPTAYIFRIVVRAEGTGGTPVRLVAGYYSREIN